MRLYDFKDSSEEDATSVEFQGGASITNANFEPVSKVKYLFIFIGLNHAEIGFKQDSITYEERVDEVENIVNCIIEDSSDADVEPVSKVKYLFICIGFKHAEIGFEQDSITDEGEVDDVENIANCIIEDSNDEFVDFDMISMSSCRIEHVIFSTGISKRFNLSKFPSKISLLD